MQHDSLLDKRLPQLLPEDSPHIGYPCIAGPNFGHHIRFKFFNLFQIPMFMWNNIEHSPKILSFWTGVKQIKFCLFAK